MEQMTFDGDQIGSYPRSSKAFIAIDDAADGSAYLENQPSKAYWSV